MEKGAMMWEVVSAVVSDGRRGVSSSSSGHYSHFDQCPSVTWRLNDKFRKAAGDYFGNVVSNLRHYFL
eukprot:scaffold1970_cov188-Alexandrium_tamarense.AAC.3